MKAEEKKDGSFFLKSEYDFHLTLSENKINFFINDKTLSSSNYKASFTLPDLVEISNDLNRYSSTHEIKEEIKKELIENKVQIIKEGTQKLYLILNIDNKNIYIPIELEKIYKDNIKSNQSNIINFFYAKNNSR